MLQVGQNYKTGALRLEEVPVPILKPGGILICNCYSAISIRDTEMNLGILSRVSKKATDLLYDLTSSLLYLERRSQCINP